MVKSSFNDTKRTVYLTRPWVARDVGDWYQRPRTASGLWSLVKSRSRNAEHGPSEHGLAAWEYNGCCTAIQDSDNRLAIPARRMSGMNDVAIKALATAQELAWIPVLPTPVLMSNPKTMRATWGEHWDQVCSQLLALHLLVSEVPLQ